MNKKIRSYFQIIDDEKGNDYEDDGRPPVVTQRWRDGQMEKLTYYEKEFDVELDDGNVLNVTSLWPSIENGCLMFSNVDIDKVPSDPLSLVGNNVIVGKGVYTDDVKSNVECVHLSKLNSSVSESVNVKNISKITVKSFFKQKVKVHEDGSVTHTQEYKDDRLETESQRIHPPDEPKTDNPVKTMVLSNE